MMRPKDMLRSSPRGTAEQAVQKAAELGAMGNYRTFIQTVYVEAPQLGLDPSIIVAQAAHETGNEATGAPFQSAYWLRDGNSAGIGIWQDGVKSPFSVNSGKTSALIHLAELAVKVLHLDPDTLPSRYAEAVKIDEAHLDKIVPIFLGAGAPPVETIDDLNVKFVDYRGVSQCTWACDPAYAAGLTGQGNRLFPDLPNQENKPPVAETIVFGNVPYPAVDNRFITSREEGDGWNQMTRQNLGLVYHTMVGSLWGTDDWFRRPGNGLTHYGVGSALVDGSNNDGHIMAWLDYKANMAPWASGPWQHGSERGEKFVAKYGVGAINGSLLAIERSGQYETPLTDATIESIAQLSAFHADRAKIPYTSYPINPANGLSFVYTHDDFQAEKPCAGSQVHAMENRIVGRTKEILRHHQVKEVDTRPKPNPFPEFTGNNKKVGKSTWYAISRKIHAGKNGAKLLAYGGGPEAAPRLLPGAPKTSIYFVPGKNSYWITKEGYRINATEIVEKGYTS